MLMSNLRGGREGKGENDGVVYLFFFFFVQQHNHIFSGAMKNFLFL